MKKIKSIFAFLLMGSLTMAGCSLFKKKGTEGGGGGDAVDRFTDKKLVYDSIVATPEIADPAQAEYVTAQYDCTYAQFFEDGKFEYVVEYPGHPTVMSGTYSLSSDKQTATILVTAMETKTGKQTLPEDEQVTMTIPYEASSGKYVYEVDLTQQVGSTIKVYYKDNGDKPSAYVFPQVVNYNVTFDANGGTGIMEAAKTDESHYELPECSFTAPEGKRFAGWSLNPNGSSLKQPHQVLDEITADIILYAIWEENGDEPVVFEISFDKNGGEGSMESVNVAEGTTITLPKCTFTNEGYDFAGWATSAEGAKVYDDEQVNVVFEADITLFALWTPTSSPEVHEAPFIQYKEAEGEWQYATLETDPEEGKSYQYKVAELSLHEGAEFVFCVSTENEGDWRNVDKLNTEYSSAAEIIVDSGEDDNFKLTADAVLDIYVIKEFGGAVYVNLHSETPEPGPTPVPGEVEAPYVMHGSDEDGWNKVALTNHNESEYKGVMEGLKAGDEFVVCVDDKSETQDWRHYEQVDVVWSTTSILKGSENEDESHNIVARADGDYTVYVRKGFGGAIFITFGEEEVVPPPFVYHGSDAAGWDKTSLQDTGSQYEIQGLELAAGEEFLLVIQGSTSVEWYGASAYVATEPDAGQVDVNGGNLVAKAAGTYDFYLNGGHIYVVYHAPAA